MAKSNPLLSALGWRIVNDKAGSYYEKDGIYISVYDEDGDSPEAPIDPASRVVVMGNRAEDYRIYENTQAAIDANFAVK